MVGSRHRQVVSKAMSAPRVFARPTKGAFALDPIMKKDRAGKTAIPPTTGREREAGEGGVAAVDRALAILAAFQTADRGLTLAQLADRTGLYKSTILRLAESLLRHRFLQRFDDGRYQLGPAPLVLAALYQKGMNVGDVVLPLMHELRTETGEGVSFYIRDGDRRVCLHRVDSRHAVRDHVHEGDVLPLGRGSGGRVLTAFSGAKGEPYATIRREYCYMSLGERDPETSGISAPIFGANQTLLGAMTLAGPSSRIDAAFLLAKRGTLLSAARWATLALGGDASALETALARATAAKRRNTSIRRR